MIINDKSPAYVKIGFQFLIVFFICFFISAAQNILIPFAFAVLVAVLLLPVVDYLESKNIGKVTSIGMAILLAIVFVAGIIYFLSSQIASFIQDIPSIKAHLNKHFIAIQTWISNKLNIPFSEQNQYLNEQADKLKNTGTGYIRTTFFRLLKLYCFYSLCLFILFCCYTTGCISGIFYSFFLKRNTT